MQFNPNIYLVYYNKLFFFFQFKLTGILNQHSIEIFLNGIGTSVLILHAPNLKLLELNF